MPQPRHPRKKGAVPPHQAPPHLKHLGLLLEDLCLLLKGPSMEESTPPRQAPPHQVLPHQAPPHQVLLHLAEVIRLRESSLNMSMKSK